MPSAIYINGRLYTGSRNFRFENIRAGESKALAANARADGKPCDGTPIPADSPDSPFRAGIPFEDEHEDVVYRVVSKINIAEGWGTAAFWMQRWGCYYTDILHFVRKGWLDAAIEEGSAVKRFRCRDELRVRAQLAAVKKPPAVAAPLPKKPAAKKKTATGGTEGANRFGFRRYDRPR